MEIKTGDMFKGAGRVGHHNIILATACSVINKQGRLVMGKGAAKSLLTLVPDCNKLFARWIKADDYPHQIIYGLLIAYSLHYGLFQTKMHWKNPSELELIQYSTKMLKTEAINNSHITYNLNYPGIGLGGLTEAEVLPIIQELPNNVKIWKFA